MTILVNRIIAHATETFSITIISPHSAPPAFSCSQAWFTRPQPSVQLNSFNPFHTVYFLAFCVRQTFFSPPKINKHLHDASFGWQRAGESLSPMQTSGQGGFIGLPALFESQYPLSHGVFLPLLPIFSPMQALSKRLCELRSLLINELASDPYLPTLILDVTHPCHFPTVCPKKALRGAQKQRVKSELTPARMYNYCKEVVTPAAVETPPERSQKLGGWLIRRSCAPISGRKNDVLREQLQ